MTSLSVEGILSKLTTDDRAVLTSLLSEGAKLHLGVFTEPWLTWIFHGKKSVESRFGKTKVAPYRQIAAGDIVLMKKSSGLVEGFFFVKEASFYELETVGSWEQVRERREEICKTLGFLEENANAKYATLLDIAGVSRLLPFSVDKIDRRGWVVLGGLDRREVDLGASGNTAAKLVI